MCRCKCGDDDDDDDDDVAADAGYKTVYVVSVTYERHFSFSRRETQL